MNLNNVPYDILDGIIDILDINSSINLLMVSNDIYKKYVCCDNKYYKIIMMNKIKKYFSSLNRIKFDYKVIDIDEVYNCLNRIYSYFNKHIDTSLCDMLIYLCDVKLSDKWFFKHIISHCYFSKNGDNTYNAILEDDLLYLLMFVEDTSFITKYIFVDAVILRNVITYKIRRKDRIRIISLFNYLLFKHFFKTSEYVEDIITDIVCDIIRSNEIVILDDIYCKQKFYKFKLNYQKIINCCIIEQKDVELLNLIHKKMLEQTQYLNINMRPLIITKESVRLLMKRKSYKMLIKIIDLYLKDTINMNSYINEILFNFDYNNEECMELLEYVNEKNKLKFKK